MKRYGSTVKFPNSVQLFKFCQKVLMHQKGGKVRDQEVGSILDFNPSDCSHWKRGEKNVKSVFGLARLSDALKLESALIHDVASGVTDLDEAYFEYLESQATKVMFDRVRGISEDKLQNAKNTVLSFVENLHQKADFSTPPLYLPEVMRCFPFINTTPVEMLDRLSRILRVKAGKYTIQFKKGELKPQTRLSMVKDLGRILFEGERNRYPELGTGFAPELNAYEISLFCANLLIPKNLLKLEIEKTDSRCNIVNELANHFWVPKSLICFQLQDMLKGSSTLPTNTNPPSESVTTSLHQ